MIFEHLELPDGLSLKLFFYLNNKKIYSIFAPQFTRVDMAHFQQNFFLVWGSLIVLILLGEGFQVLASMGFSDLNSFAEFLIPRVIGIGILSAILLYFVPLSPFSRSKKAHNSNNTSNNSANKLVKS